MDDNFDIARLLKLRKQTRAVADYLTRELRSHLSTLTPLLNPKLVFGDHILGGRKIAGDSSAQAMEELQSLYQEVHRTKPFSLRARFDTPLSLMSASLEIQPAFYTHAIPSEGGEAVVSITSPLNWILSFEGFGPSHLTELLTSTADIAGAKRQECVIHALLLHVTLQKRTGVCDLLRALRFTVSTERMPEFGELPLVMISAPLSTVRPPDWVIIESTEISGNSQFEEIIDGDSVLGVEDPLKQRLLEVVGG